MPLDPTSTCGPGLTNLGEFVADDRVVAAMRTTQRGFFDATEDEPIEQLRIARICELLRLTGDESLLHAGTGSAAQIAVLSQLACWVVVVEPEQDRSRWLKQWLRDVDVQNVTIVLGEPRRGFSQGAPYDAIVVSGDTQPKDVAAQLAAGGRLVAASGDRRLLLAQRKGNGAAMTTTVAGLVPETLAP